MNKLVVVILIFTLNLAFTNCADESYNTSTTTANVDTDPFNFDHEKLAPLNDKYLFLEEYYNSNGEKEFKEPYHYYISVFKLLALIRPQPEINKSIEIRVPSSDCNFTHLECAATNDVFYCTVISTLMGCFYRNDLSTYFEFPESFTIDVNLNSVIITNAKNKSRAVFKIYNSKNELPVYKEPLKIKN